MEQEYRAACGNNYNYNRKYPNLVGNVSRDTNERNKIIVDDGSTVYLLYDRIEET